MSGEARTTIDVDVTAGADVPREQVDAVRGRLQGLDRHTDEPILGARITIRRAGRKASRPWVADAHVLVDGRTLAAHTTGRSPEEAADEAAERLRRQLRRIAGAEVAVRDEPRRIQAALEALPSEERHLPQTRLKPPEEREIVHRRPYLDTPLSTIEAIDELLSTDAQFLLFRHVRTGEDVVVYRRDDGRIGLIHPPGSPLADEADVLVPKPDKYDGPVSFAHVREEMDLAGHRFLFFVDEADGRGKVIYLRHDGDYGVVEPA
jgi:ribosome-associated translation inhibitor RaiA